MISHSKMSEVSTTASYVKTRILQAKRLLKHRVLYLMLLPGFLYYVIFRYLPMYGITLAFKDYDFLGGILKSPWAEPLFKHFRLFWSSPYFGNLMRNTFSISFYQLIAGVLPPIALAILLTECHGSRYRRFVQSVSFFPYFLSG